MHAPTLQRTRTVVVDALPPPHKLYGRALPALFRRHRSTQLPALRLLRPDVRLDAEHIGRYAHVCGFIPEHGVPLTFPHVLAFPLHLMMLTDPSFPWSALGVMHMANSVHLRRPLAAGQPLRIEVECGPLVPHRKGQAHAAHAHLPARRSRVGRRQRLFETRRAQRRRSARYAPGSRSGDRPGPAARPRSALATARATRPRLRESLGRLQSDPPACAECEGVRLSARDRARHVDARAHGEFRSPLYLLGEATLLLGEATLWTAAPSSVARDFEVRDLAGDRAHLRGHFEWELP